MKTFIVDWGKNSNGSRYAIVQATDIDRASLSVDAIGAPFKIQELKIPEGMEGERYLEIDAPKEPWTGPEIKEFFKKA